jgi:glutaminyl-peptide cyclotransferase
MRLLLATGLVCLAACTGGGGDPAGGPAGNRVQPPVAQETPGPSESPAPPGFDADSAWVRLERQLAFGPRVPGSAAHRACADWLAGELERAGGRVERDAFTYRDPDGRVWPLENLLGRFGPEGENRLLLVAHWDTRPWADLDPDPARRDRPIPGANDGASGVAVLLEVARVFGVAPPPGGVDILFTDGEDLGRAGVPEGFARGALRFAGRGLAAYRRAVVLDMIGDADLRIPVEGYSRDQAPEVVDWVWERGRRLEPLVFTTERGPYIVDDHVPLLTAGLPSVDLIDFDYPYWHTADDDLAAVSPASLGAVGRVLLSLIYFP